MGRVYCCDKSGLKKGPWTSEEDQKLIDYIHKHGDGKWRTLPKNAGLKRCGKSCRFRWMNYLRPDIKRGRFSFEEEETIIQFHRILGNKWSTIASRLPGRTDNEIKNYWNTHIRKRLLKLGLDPVTHAPRLDLVQVSSFLYSNFYNSSSHAHNLHVPNLLGIGPFMDPGLLNLVLSCQGRPDYPSQHQENQLAGLFGINQNQLQSQLLVQQQPNLQNLVQEIQSCNLNSPFQHQPQLTEFSSPSSVPTTTTNQLGSNYQQACNIANNENQYQSFQNTCNAFESHGSTTPSSSPGTALDSSSPAMTFVNSSSTINEDEMDSFCSNILRMYQDLPGGFNVTELL